MTVTSVSHYLTQITTVACGMFSLLSRENKIVFATWVHRCYIYIMTTRLFYNNIVTTHRGKIEQMY